MASATLPAAIDVRPLTPTSSGEVRLTPETEVLCLHRGQHVITDMFDSRTYVIEPGYFTCPYAVAKHFQQRAVVPGTRNPEKGVYAQQSFLAIIGVSRLTPKGLEILKAVDPVEDCQPFTDDEVAQYGLKVEALDRDGMLDPIRHNVALIGTNEVRVAMAGAGASRKSTNMIVDEGALDPVAPEDNAALREIAADSVGAQAEQGAAAARRKR